MTEVAALGLRVTGVADIDRASSSLDRLTKSSKSADQVSGSLSAESRNTSKALADASKSADDFSNSLQKVLDRANPLGKAHRENARDADILKKAYREGRIGAEEFARANDFLERELKDTEKALGKTSAAVSKMAKLAAGAFAGIKLTGLIKDVTMANSRFEQLGMVMGVVGRNAGLSQSQVARYAKEVESMGISMTESRQTVIRMIQAQMDLTKAAELARLAQDAAVIANTNSSDALGRLIIGLQSGQVEILRNMGLNVNFAASYSKLAAEMGVTVDQLSEVDKVQARTNAVMEAGSQIAGSYAASMGNAGKQLGSTTRHVENLQVALGAVWQGEFSGGVEAYSSALKVLGENADTVAQVLKTGVYAAAGMAAGALAKKTAATVSAMLAARAQAAEELRLANAHVAATAQALAHATANNTLTGATGRLTAATVAHEAALKRQAAAQAASAGIGRALLGVMGGPAGLAITAGAVALSFVNWGRSAEEAARESIALREETNLLTRAVKELDAAQAQQVLQKMEEPYKVAKEEARKYAAQIEYLTMQLDRHPRSAKVDEWNRSLVDARGNLSTVNEAIAEQEEKMRRLNERINEITQAREENNNVLAETDEVGKRWLASLQQRADFSGGLTEVQRVSIAIEKGYAGALSETDKALALANAAIIDRNNAIKSSVKPIKDIDSAYRSLYDSLFPAEAAHRKYNEQIALLKKHLSGDQLARAVSKLTKEFTGGDADGAAKAIEEYNKNLKTLVDRLNPAAVAARTFKEEQELLLDAIARTGDPTGELARSLKTLEQQYAETSKVTNEWTKWTESALERVDSAFADAWRNIGDGFGSFRDNLTNAFKQMLAELAHLAITRPIVLQIGAALGIGGASGSALAGVAGGGGGDGGIGGLSGLWSGARSLIGGNQFGSGISDLGRAISPTGDMGNWFSSAGQYANWQYGLAGIVGGLAGNMLGGYGGTGGSLGATIGMAAGGPIGAVAGAVIGAVLGSLFGGSKTSPELNLRTVATGTMPSGGTGWEHHGGAYASGVFGDIGFADYGTQRLSTLFPDGEHDFLEAIAGMDAMMASLAQSEEQFKAMESAARSWSASAGGPQGIVDQLSDRTAAILGAIDGEFGRFVASIDGGLEEIVATALIAREAMSLLSASQERLGFRFDETAKGAYESALAIAELTGGLDNLAALQSSYYQAYFSETEHAAHLLEDLTQALAEMGMQLPKSRDGFRALVEAQDLNTEAGQRNYVALLQLAGGFDQLQQRLEAAAAGIAREREGLERSLLQLQGNTAEIRRRELEQLDPSNRALQQHIWALQDQEAAASEAAAGINNAMHDLQGAFRQLEKSVQAEQRILREAHSATTQSIRNNMSRVQDAMSRTDRIASSLRSTLDGMMRTDLGLEPARAQSQAYLRNVLASGGLGDPDELKRALQVVAEPSEHLFSNFEDYQRDFWRTAKVVSKLEERASEQLTTEQRSLQALEQQITQADRQFEREMARLDGVLEQQAAVLAAQHGHLDWLATINDSALSIADAIAALEFAFEAAKLTPLPPPPPPPPPSGGGSSGSIRDVLHSDLDAVERTIRDAYAIILQSSISAADIDYWSSVGLERSELARAIAHTGMLEGSQHAASWWERYGHLDEIPGFATGGIASGPMSGYPVELHGTEAVIPLNGGNIPLNVPGIKALLREVTELRRDLAASQRTIAENTGKSARVLEREEMERRQEELV